MEKTNATKTNLHIFVKYGSSAIGMKIGDLESKYGLSYIHMHDGFKPTPENRVENYNKKMKIKPCALYKFNGLESQFNKLCSQHNNLEIITDQN